MNREQLRDIFAPLRPPRALDALTEFDEAVGGCYAEGFAYERRNGHRLRQLSSDPRVTDRLIVFGQANEDGSEFAVWNVPPRSAESTAPESILEEMPIVILGDEGGIHPVASNAVEFLRLLSFDRDLAVSEERVWFSQDELHDDSPFHAAYRVWFEAHFAATLTTRDEIAQNAQRRYGRALTAFLSGPTNTSH
ncbi:hypothetical protein [Subtercola endophyticus]|uniref:hypothetical protein n=1 Tax=Subtercola endophyticus TaxID=2895559 RepID=UPI001E2D5AFD|nr:hypothetical protein [Subtercola endophyticus]UFS60995.1 hypothetical protein LQ955_09800 [Subtercola endophyticus]